MKNQNLPDTIHLVCKTAVNVLQYKRAINEKSVFGCNLHINTTSGYIKGQTVEALNISIDEFLGIPYAKPPVGTLRFAKPVPITLTEPLNRTATNFRPQCLHHSMSFGNQSEDCLYLNIWAPSFRTNNPLNPVMVYMEEPTFMVNTIHRIRRFNGSALAAHDVVVISVSYRVSVLGYLYGGEESAPGNVAIYDQIQALESVFGCNLHINTTSGYIKGQTVEALNISIDEFLGIPYAKPPVRTLRFAKLVPIALTEPLNRTATNFRPQCLHHSMSYANQSEDCLYLNIWAPSFRTNNVLNPVMVYMEEPTLLVNTIHRTRRFNGSALAAHDVVVISVSYRVSVLGYLYGGEESAPGNVAIYDQIQALNWIRDNSQSFCGDRNRITAFGQSGGSISVSALVLSPQSRGLFRRAILQSGAQLHAKGKEVYSKTDAINEAKQMARQLHCGKIGDYSIEWLNCLRNVNLRKLLMMVDTPIQPIVEGTELLPMIAQKAFIGQDYNRDLDILAGVVQNEGSLLALNQWPELVNDISEQTFTELVNKSKIVDYYLKNVYKTQNVGCNEKTMGICHGSDLVFVSGAPFIYPNDGYTTRDMHFSVQVMKLWTNFAKYGKPNDNNWPQLMARKKYNQFADQNQL
ncbi:unnamed protein product [Medioppia subpectinata]|uniref:Carboxylesterase type B domain-containing protein n=1 Tax=Medioppia subpectinata TaxID=1979941 RepID=A0A7R9PWD9_9ACAR|nr:unnamed protein product [Medioppia subpectinata]CAG2103598.1 unnamed protein product [Medioppia subpectinata]